MLLSRQNVTIDPKRRLLAYTKSLMTIALRITHALAMVRLAMTDCIDFIHPVAHETRPWSFLQRNWRASHNRVSVRRRPFRTFSDRTGIVAGHSQMLLETSPHEFVPRGAFPVLGNSGRMPLGPELHHAAMI